MEDGSTCSTVTRCRVPYFWGLRSGLVSQVPCLGDPLGVVGKKETMMDFRRIKAAPKELTMKIFFPLKVQHLREKEFPPRTGFFSGFRNCSENRIRPKRISIFVQPKPKPVSDRSKHFERNQLNGIKERSSRQTNENDLIYLSLASVS